MSDLVIDATAVFNEAVARRALTAAFQRRRLPATSVELIRLGSNAVFRVDDDVIGRVAPSLAQVENAVKQVAVSRWLMSLGYSVVEATDVEQPVEAEGCVVTFWDSVAPEIEYAPKP